jgi:N4-gp56 family major capsid protein
MQTWTYDAPSGVYKNHDMSEQLRYAAIAETKFMQFVRPESGYGKKKGESVTITRISNLAVPSNARLSESEVIPESVLSMTTKAITVSEFGRAVPYSSLSDDLGKFNMENVVQKTLRDQMALVMDNAVAATFKGSDNKIKYAPTSSSAGTFDTDGVMSTTALANLNVYHVEVIRDYMYSTLRVPTYEGGDYVCLISTKAKRGLVSDSAWEKWHQYTNPEAKYNGEIGRIEGIRFVEVNNTDALSGSKGSGGVLGEAVFFGADAVVMAVVKDPELLAEAPKDFGRQKAVAWYGVLDFGVVWDTANAGEARIVTVTSA